MATELQKTYLRIYSRIDKLAIKGKDRKYQYFALVDEFIDGGNYDNFLQVLYYYYNVDISQYSNNDILKLKNGSWKDILRETNSTFQRKLKNLYDNKLVYQQGYDIWSESVLTLGLSMSGPLSSSYSNTSATQSITATRTGDYVYFTTNDTQIYSMELYKCEWILKDGIVQPFQKTLELFQRFDMYATQSTYKTEISIYHGKQYLIKTKARNNNVNYTQLNYRLDVSKNLLLGQIKEIDNYVQSSDYYVESIGLAKFQGIKKTFLEVTKTGTASVFISFDISRDEDFNLLKRYEFAINYLLS